MKNSMFKLGKTRPYFQVFSIVLLLSYPSLSKGKLHKALLYKSNKKIEEAIKLAANFLFGQILPNGKFIYKVNMANGKTSNQYNIVRHAGAVYALAKYLQVFPNQRQTKLLKKATIYLLTQTKISTLSDSNYKAIWSTPKLNNNVSSIQVKLGAVGLGLVALLEADKVYPGVISLEDLNKLGNFILFMQKEDGSFYSKYDVRRGRDDSWTSLYYPGEAALGLIALYEKKPQKKWIKSAEKALLYLASTREGRGHNIESDHWALLATTRLLKQFEKKESSKLNKLIFHSLQVSKKMLNDQILFSKDQLLIGGFSDDGRVTPSSTNLEGLLASYEMLDKNYEVIRNRILDSIVLGLDFILKAQIKNGQYKGAFPRAIMPLKGADSRHFNKRVEEVRIDYVQHSLSSFLQFKSISDKSTRLLK